MSKTNISEDFTKQYNGDIPSENGVCSSGRIVTLRPVTSNISAAGALYGEVRFTYTTGSNEYVDIAKCQIVLKYTTSDITNLVILEDLVDCAFSRGQLYLNDKMVAQSTNYTEDAVFNKRISNSAGKNNGFGNLTYLDDVAAATTLPGVAGDYISAGDLSGLFVNNGKSKYIPPNTTITINLSSDVNMKQKSAIGDGSDSAVTVVVQDIYMRVPSLISSAKTPASYMIKFLTVDSFKNTITGTTHNNQITCKPNLVKVGCAFQSTAATTDTLEFYNHPHFKYVADLSTHKVNTLYFKAGSQVLPAQQLDFTYGFEEAYRDFVSENRLDEDGNSPEDFRTEWSHQGPIYTYNVVKDFNAPISNVEMIASFATAPAANSFIFCVNEQICIFNYQNEVPSGTSTSF